MLASGQNAAAERALGRAARSLDPDLRYRALYNAGVASLREAEADSAHRDSLLANASVHLMEALSIMPSSDRAKWNLELAQRRRPPPPSGGGGNKQKQPPSGGQQPPDPGQGQSQSGQGTPNLSQSQAEQILNSVSREERDTRARRLGKTRAPVTGVKDW